ncbi:hypothetical protein PhCBS80983_g04408 [Powellomyces hirtus]|uniref:Regulator of volume decrease after cellular swelling-domain-containing protein n=1 Tax=Powellomyces hirtus TaxID=109895 RepID=A0A507DZL3_9FUNG|nr:hypothetical protein PhCBS80983_g04408 [Powellomyces hirtus]
MTITITSQLPDLITPDHAWPGVLPSTTDANGEATSPTTATTTANTTPTVRHCQRNVSLIFEPALSTGLLPGKGDLYITDSRIFFFNPTTSVCVGIDYPSIGIHAISRGGNEVGNLAHIYGQLDSAAMQMNGSAEEDEDEEITPEFRLVPDDVAALDAIYQAISSCAALHPDPDADLDGQDESGDWIYPSNDPEELNELQQAALAHLDSVFEGPNPLGNAGSTAWRPAPSTRPADQFADADEDMQR